MPQRINDTYLKYADKIEFYHRSGITKNAVLAATWTKSAAGSEKQGVLTVANKAAYNNVKKIQDTAVAQLEAVTSAKKDDLKWQNAVEEKSDIVWPVVKKSVATPWKKDRLRTRTSAIKPDRYGH